MAISDLVFTFGRGLIPKACLKANEGQQNLHNVLY